jgi:hypothetical protein
MISGFGKSYGRSADSRIRDRNGQALLCCAGQLKLPSDFEANYHAFPSFCVELEEYCHEDYGMLTKILGNDIVDESKQLKSQIKNDLKCGDEGPLSNLECARAAFMR